MFCLKSFYRVQIATFLTLAVLAISPNSVQTATILDARLQNEGENEQIFLPFGQNQEDNSERWLIAQRQERVALVIGNGAYQEEPLSNSINDSTDIARKLRQLGFEVISHQNKDLDGMEEAIDIFSQRLRQGAVGVFYYAGHGVQVEGENYLIPLGAKLKRRNDVRYEALPIGKIINAMEDAENQMNIIIIDACRNNPFYRQWRSPHRGSSSVRGLAPIQSARGTLIAFSTAPGEFAEDGEEGRNSPYTSHLLRHIGTPNLDVELMFKKVREGVIQDTDDEQVPWESSSLIGSFAFNTVDESLLPRPNSTSNLVEESNSPQPQPEPSPTSPIVVTSGSTSETLTSETSSTPSAAVASGTSSGLSETEIGRILRSVTVFTITSNIQSAAFSPEETSLAIQIAKQRQSDYYISPDDAQQSISHSNSSLNTRRCDSSLIIYSLCELGQITQSFNALFDVTPISLADIYHIDRDNRTQEEELDIPFIPIRRQVKFARRVSENSDFDGVPLFTAKGGETGEYLTIEQNGKQVIPFFFTKEQLNKMIEDFEEKNPRLANTVQIQVTSLEDLIVTLERDYSAKLENIFLVPTPESLAFIRALGNGAANNIIQNLDGTVIQNIDGTVTIQVR